MIKIKFCGLKQECDLKAALDLGVDAIGFVFYPSSPRNVSVQEVCRLTAIMPPLVLRVGLFVDAPIKQVRFAFEKAKLNLVQLHGHESFDYCKFLNLPYLKALHMTDDIELHKEISSYPGSSGFLLDSFKSGLPGGTGISFDWSRVPCGDARLVLAGGLNHNNVKEAINKTRIGAVDVSSGIEISPGIKDPDMMKKFVREVRRIEV